MGLLFRVTHKLGFKEILCLKNLRDWFTNFLIVISEYAHNGSLYAYLRKPETTFDFEHIVRWAREIAQGILKLFPNLNFVEIKFQNVLQDEL